MDDYENGPDNCRENMQEDDPTTREVNEGIFSSSKCEPKKKECKVEKKKSGCGCAKSASSKKSKKRKRSIAHYNPFIVFYLQYYYKNPSPKVTQVAIQAAKIWCRMSPKDRACYIKIAREESARRQKMCKKVKRRKRLC